MGELQEEYIALDMTPTVNNQLQIGVIPECCG